MNALNNEVILKGIVLPVFTKIRAINKQGIKVYIKVQDDMNEGNHYNIPIYFLNINSKEFMKYKNKQIIIDAHIDNKWGMRIIADSFASEIDNEVLLMIN